MTDAFSFKFSHFSFRSHCGMLSVTLLINMLCCTDEFCRPTDKKQIKSDGDALNRCVMDD